jgi:hypothetical protein
MNLFLKISLITTTLILLIATYLHPVTAITQDLGRHIKTGEIIVTTHTIPVTNLYSYTYPTFPFINHHWGPEVLFYLTYQAAGFIGTLLLTATISVIAFLLLYLYAYKNASVLALSLVSFFCIGILLERTDVRPEAFSMLFFAIYLVILFKNTRHSTKWLYALIPIQLLWVNTHIYWAIGLLTIGLFFLDTLTTSLYKRIRITRSIATLFTVLFLCTVVTLINPHGIQGFLYPLHVFDNYGYMIEENQNIFFLWELFQKQTIIFFWASVVFYFSLLGIRFKQTRPIDWFLGSVFALLGIQAIRNFPLFAFAIFIPFSFHLSSILTPLEKKRNTYIVVSFCCILLFCWQLLRIEMIKPTGISTPNGATKGVDFMQTHNLKGPIFNNFDIGSYLIFRLYPREKVFVDGRPEAYPAAFFQKIYIPMQQDPKLFAAMDKKYQFNTIFFSHTDQTPWAKQFLQTISKNPLWKLVYLDDTVVIFTKASSPTPALSLSSFTPSSTSLQGFYQLLLFFQTIRDEQNMLKTAQKILEKNPNDCVALSLLSQPPTGVGYYARYQASCK